MKYGYAWLAIQCLVVCCQLSCIQTQLWKTRSILFTSALLVQVASFGLLLQVPRVLALWSVLVSLYLVLDTVRVIRHKQSDEYLKISVFHNQLRLGLYLAIPWVVYMLRPALSSYEVMMLMAIISYFAAGILLVSTVRSFWKARVPEAGTYSDKDLPTVTLAFPARNETERISETLQAALSSNYPKLEILVLDDCSQDNTPEIVSTYAQDGIRFISGDMPKPHWLGKNWAYERLSKEASGDYVLFAGVDVHMTPEAIRHLVSYALDKHADMVSVMPRRDRFHFLAGLLAPPRYFWQMAIPRLWRKNPPVLSSLWLIKRDVLEELGGIEAVSHKVIPEAFFARELAKKRKYRFVLANYYLGFHTHKSLDEQLETEHRTLYPELRRRPSRVLISSIGIMTCLIIPFVGVALGFWQPIGPAYRIFVATTVMLTLAHLISTTILYPASWPLSLINFPITMVIELVNLNYSMLQYEFDEVTWKGRNVCVPAMHQLEVIAHLPALKPRRR